MAVPISAAAVVSMRSRLFPAWFSWTSLVVAVGLLSPIAYAVLALALLWLVVASIWLYLKGALVGEPSAQVEPA